MSGINMFLKPKSLYKCLFQITYNSLHKIALAVHLVPNAESIIFFLGQWKIGTLWKSSSQFRNYKIRVRLSCG